MKLKIFLALLFNILRVGNCQFNHAGLRGMYSTVRRNFIKITKYFQSPKMVRRREGSMPVWKHHGINNENQKQENLVLWPYNMLMRNNYFSS